MDEKDNWDGKRFHSLDFALKKRLGKKVAKLALDASMTCPTRDGTKGVGGCLFCSSRGSGDFTQYGSITEQMEQQAQIALAKWKDCAFIPYFQSYTNTYASVETLRKLFDEALAYPGSVGLAVATRCDCLQPEVLELLNEYNQRTFLWVELGLQTVSDDTGRIIRRGFSTQEFVDAVTSLDEYRILTVVHLIAGLPAEDQRTFLESVRFVAGLPVWGIKLQMLNILFDSDLYQDYLQSPYRLFSREEYVEVICDAIELLPPRMVIHRLTGDGKKANLYEPQWVIDKRRVLTEINQELQRRKSVQGKLTIPKKPMDIFRQMHDK